MLVVVAVAVAATITIIIFVARSSTLKNHVNFSDYHWCYCPPEFWRGEAYRPQKKNGGVFSHVPKMNCYVCEVVDESVDGWCGCCLCPLFSCNCCVWLSPRVLGLNRCIVRRREALPPWIKFSQRTNEATLDVKAVMKSADKGKLFLIQFVTAENRILQEVRFCAFEPPMFKGEPCEFFIDPPPIAAANLANTHRPQRPADDDDDGTEMLLMEAVKLREKKSQELPRAILNGPQKEKHQKVAKRSATQNLQVVPLSSTVDVDVEEEEEKGSFLSLPNNVSEPPSPVRKIVRPTIDDLVEAARCHPREPPPSALQSLLSSDGWATRCL